MYTFFKTEERYAVERRKLPAFCRVKKAVAEQKRLPQNQKRLPRNKKPPRENFPAAAYIAILNF